MDSDHAENMAPVDFSGTWELEKSENFEKYMDILAKNENFVVRQSMKMARYAKPVQTIRQNGDKFSIETKVTFWTGKIEFTIGDDYESNERGHKLKGVGQWEGNKLVIKYEPVENPTKLHKQIITREIIDDEMVMTLELVGEEFLCKRYYKRIDA
ncbi:sodium/calcium exchanger regulatory protein 1-like [Tubulanus polymorphus]|uniref:sodium/calcium exchanger regulatory protein 1-like n=1 Tax=Tubulanus polymorphus TaxID=672921 RepID=UPI003DA3E228